MLQSLILIDSLSSASWEKKRKRKKKKKREREREREMARGLFFPRAGHALLAVPHRIFMAVRC
jgi:hypothetical protein